MSVRNIIITDNVDTSTLLNDLMFVLSSEEISKTATMASGRTVKDIIGYKNVLNIPVGYLSLENVALLRKMIDRNAGVLTISYPTPNGDKTNLFSVEPPTYATFDYDDSGVAIWKGVTIKASTMEVVK